MPHIQPQYQVLDDLLQKRLFRIPDYQRAYSWDRRQRQELFDDILKLVDQDDDRHHFMATIVCLKTPNKEVVGTKEFQYLDVVDGQQRLTTLIILLKAISLKLAAGGDADVDEATDVAKVLVKGDQRLILLQTNHDSSHIFANYLRSGEHPVKTDIYTHADSRLAAAMKDCEAFVSKFEPIPLLKIIKNRLGFIFYELQHESTVYTVFEVLNSRGLEVDAIDKCKSMLMGLAFEHQKGEPEAANESINELHSYWKKIYEEIGVKPIPNGEILRFAASLYDPEEQAKTLSDDKSIEYFRKRGSQSFKNIADISKWLLRVAKVVVSIHNNARWAAVTKITQARLLLVALQVTDTLNDDQRKRAILQWENVTFRIYSLFDKDSRTAIGDFNKLAQRIVAEHPHANSYPKIMKELRALGEKFGVVEAVQDFANRDNAYDGWEESLRHFLFRYEHYLAEQDGEPVSSELWDQIWSDSAAKSIEHIAPQTFSSNWSSSISDYESTYSSRKHLLGNLLLLPPKLNSKAGTKSFSDKKLLYQGNFLRIMNDVLNCDGWGPDQIDHRTRIMLNWAEKAFDDVAE